jgi:membrane protease YdiL (CAAX protease family)
MEFLYVRKQHMLHMQLDQAQRMKPMPLWMAALFFGLPALVIRIFLYLGIPFLMSTGLRLFEAWLICTIIPLGLLLIAAIVAYHLENPFFSRSAFQERFRLNPLPGKAWFWIVGGFLVAFLGNGALAFSARWIASIPLFAPPAALAYLDPRTSPDLSYTSFMGVPLLGNWWVLVAVLLLLVVNTLGEELWWRGYILPRQELSHGKGAWVVHGLLWTLFHVVFYPWVLFSYLPVCLTIPFIVQRFNNTWPAIILHFAINGVILIPITLGILGVHG